MTSIATRQEKLEDKYTALLQASSKLLERTARRHKSIKDVERSVKYLRSLYNQLKTSDNSQTSASLMDEVDDETGQIDEDLGKKRVFMVSEDKAHRLRRREVKEREKITSKLGLWNSWNKQRAQLEKGKVGS